MKFTTIFILLTTFSLTNSVLRGGKTATLKKWLIEEDTAIQSVPNITIAPFNTFDPFKYYVSLCHPDIKRNQDWRRKKNYLICGGSLVRRNKVLTAADCVVGNRHKLFKPYDFIVVVHGSKDVFGTGGKFYDMADIVVSIQLDIAIIILDRNVDGILDSDCLRLSKETPRDMTLGLFSGYGRFYEVPV